MVVVLPATPFLLAPFVSGGSAAELAGLVGGILQDLAYGEVWTEARQQALTPAQCRSPLGRRPYDLRHATVLLWRNSGAPATEVARRTSHGAAVLLKIYAH